MGEAPEAAVEDVQVKFDDEKLIGMAFVMMGWRADKKTVGCPPKRFQQDRGGDIYGTYGRQA